MYSNACLLLGLPAHAAAAPLITRAHFSARSKLQQQRRTFGLRRLFKLSAKHSRKPVNDKKDGKIAFISFPFLFVSPFFLLLSPPRESSRKSLSPTRGRKRRERMKTRHFRATVIRSLPSSSRFSSLCQISFFFSPFLSSQSLLPLFSSLRLLI